MSESYPEGKALVVDDHPLVREALRGVLEALFRPLEYAGAGSLDEALERVEGTDFDLVLLDLHLPGADGLSALLKLRCAAPATPIVIVSQSDDAELMHSAIACGAAGFIPKALPREQIEAALRRVLAGDVFLPAAPDAATPPALHSLTPRQLAVFDLMLQGHSNKLIAYTLQISEWTVKAHVSAILRALQVTNRVEAVLAAKRLGLGGRG